MAIAFTQQRAGTGALRVATAWSNRMVEAERERWLLWLPVAFGLGIALYFGLDQEPAWWWALGPLVLTAGGLLLLRHRLLAAYGLALLLAFVAGFALAQLRTAVVAAPLLTERFGPTEVTGTILGIERRVKDTRLLIHPQEIEGLTPAELPMKVRLRVAGKKLVPVEPGDRVQLRAVLLPPPPPVVPGGYDFGRQAYYRQIGASGFVLGSVSLEARGQESGWLLFWNGLRDHLGQRVRASLPPQEAGIAEALLTGQRAGIDPQVQEDFRRSGLAHLLAISGLHVGLIAGLFFFSLRALLALSPSVALRWPIKKIAALVTALLLPLYLPMVGASVPTQRACLMTLIVLIAVLLDRRAITLRLVAFAALVVLAWMPETLLSASFQLSFAAVTALVAVYETWRNRRPDWPDRLSPDRRLLLYLFGVLISSLIATLATAPFAAFHFQRLALYGLGANLLAVPLTAFWIMPWCLVSYLLLPFGLENLAFIPLGWGLSALNGIAAEVASLPGATIEVPAMPLWGLAALAFGGLWLCLWRSRWRLAGVALLILGAVSPAFQRPPDILITGDMRLIGLTGPGEQLWLSSRRVGRFPAEVWLRRRAETEGHYWSSSKGAKGQGAWLACDSLGCRYRHAGAEAALALKPEALREDCQGADLLIAFAPVPRSCRPGGPIIDRFDFWREGTHAVWLSEAETEIGSVKQSRGARPWNPPRRSGRVVVRP